MKRYKLLKDLPTIKAGEIFKETVTGYNEKNLLVRIAPLNAKSPRLKVQDIDNFDEWFEEIQEPTDSIHWKPRQDDGEYWIVNSYGSIVKRIWSDSIEDINMYKLGFIYPTEEKCKKDRNRKLAEVRLRRTSTFKPCLKSGMYAYTVGYDFKHKRLYVTKLVDVIIGNPITYKSFEEAERSIEENEKDWMIYFGIEKDKEE